MSNATVVIKGPLFATDLDARMFAANVAAAHKVAPMVGRALRENYSGGVVKSGPGRYGHVADMVRHSVEAVGETVAARIFTKGRAAFKAVILEHGHRGPHRGGASGLLLPKDRRDREAKREGHAAALKIGPLIRRQAQPGPARGFKVAELTQQQQERAAFAVFQRAIGEVVGA